MGWPKFLGLPTGEDLERAISADRADAEAILALNALRTKLGLRAVTSTDLVFPTIVETMASLYDLTIQNGFRKEE